MHLVAGRWQENNAEEQQSAATTETTKCKLAQTLLYRRV
jgi:hypothetical protein